MKPQDAAIAALTARQATLDAELAAARRERDEIARMIDERRKLPVLPNIRVASQCPADWNQMVGDDRVRACAKCNKNVYNLSAMTRADAEALIVSTKGELCAQYWQRKDGTILLSDCTVQGVRRRNQLTAIAAATAIAGTAFLAHATHPRPHHPTHVDRPPVTVQLPRVPVVPSIVQMPPPPIAQDPPPVEQELEPQMQMKRGGIRIHHDPDITR